MRGDSVYERGQCVTEVKKRGRKGEGSMCQLLHTDSCSL